MPPWAATVCERVGNTLVRTATLRPASDNCKEARIPEPPAPTITASKRRRGNAFLIAVIVLHFPQNFGSIGRTSDQPQHSQGLQGKANAYRLDVIHPDITNANPRMIKKT